MVVAPPALLRRSVSGLAFIVVLVIIALSPFILNLTLSGTDLEWGRLSDIGQTYGAISALLSAGALVALGVSLILQAREVRHAREQAARSAQFELMRMVLDNPVYQEVLGSRMQQGLTIDESRRDIYLNLLLNWWQMRWEFKDMPEVEVREAAKMDVFTAQAGRDYWRRRGDARLSYANTGRGRRFNHIFDEEYRAALARGPLERMTPQTDNDTVSRRRRVEAAAAGLGAGLAIGFVFHRVMARS